MGVGIIQLLIDERQAVVVHPGQTRALVFLQHQHLRVAARVAVIHQIIRRGPVDRLLYPVAVTVVGDENLPAVDVREMAHDVVLIAESAGIRRVPVCIVFIAGQPVVGGVGRSLRADAGHGGRAVGPVAHGIETIGHGRRTTKTKAGAAEGFPGQAVQVIVGPIVHPAAAILRQRHAVARRPHGIGIAGQWVVARLPDQVGQPVSRIVLIQIRHAVSIAEALQVANNIVAVAGGQRIAGQHGAEPAQQVVLIHIRHAFGGAGPKIRQAAQRIVPVIQRHLRSARPRHRFVIAQFVLFAFGRNRITTARASAYFRILASGSLSHRLITGVRTWSSASTSNKQRKASN